MLYRGMMTGFACVLVGSLALVTLAAHSESRTPQSRGWWRLDAKSKVTARAQAAQTTAAITGSQPGQLSSQPVRDFLEGQRLFDRETFGGNGRTCLTCHSRETGTVSPRDAHGSASARIRTIHCSCTTAATMKMVMAWATDCTSRGCSRTPPS